MPARGEARELHGHPHRARPAGAEEHLGEVGIRRELRELARERNSLGVGVAPRAEGQLQHLLRDGTHHGGIPEPNLVHRVAMEVHVSAPLRVRAEDTLGLVQRIQARGGQ